MTDPSPAIGFAKRRAIATNKANPALGTVPIANLYRNSPGFSGIQQEENETNFNYNSLQFGIRMENKHGLTFQVAYTYSHEIDSQSNDLGSVSNPYNIAYDRGSGALDRRQIFNVNYIYQFPFFAKSGNTFERVASEAGNFRG